MRKYTKDDSRIVITVNGYDYVGWLESNIEQSIENISSRFSVPVTLIPGKRPDINRQDLIKIAINEKLVSTGYVLGAEPFYRHDDCGLRITGRSKTGDLVVCSAIHKGGQWQSAKLDQIARDLCKPFGIEVVVATDVGAALTDFTIEHGETVLATLSRAARMRGILITADPEGKLLLTRAGKEKSHGAIVRGQNVISMESVGTDAERFSTYIGYGQHKAIKKSLAVLSTTDTTADIDFGKDFEKSIQQKATATDTEMKRYLPLIINPEGSSDAPDIRRLVEHTMRVRRGQSYGLRYRLEGWTYEGKPWKINTLVPIYDDIVDLNGEEWLIAEISLKADVKDGDVADILVRPKDAYDTTPIKPRQKKKKKGDKKLEVMRYQND